MTRARLLARHLIAQHSRGRSWRTIAREDYCDRVHFATLNRIAKTGGEWLPKDAQILAALGLKRERKPRTEVQEIIISMSQMARQGLRLWKRRKQ
jgi:hypothetical protein